MTNMDFTHQLAGNETLREKKKQQENVFLQIMTFLNQISDEIKLLPKKKEKKITETKQNKPVLSTRISRWLTDDMLLKVRRLKECRWCCQRGILSFHFVQPFSLKTSPRFIFDLNKSLNFVTVLMAQENAWMIFSNVFSVEW